jgi:hypothetical protein
MSEAAWGTNDPRDIRTYYPNEPAYLKAMRRRYACQFCGTSPARCPGCADLDARIAALEAAA